MPMHDCHSENGVFVVREWNDEFRELLRECPGIIRELRFLMPLFLGDRPLFSKVLSVLVF